MFILQARLEYDIYRNEEMTLRQQTNLSTTVLAAAEQKRIFHKQKYEKLKEDVKVSLIFYK